MACRFTRFCSIAIVTLSLAPVAALADPGSPRAPEPAKPPDAAESSAVIEVIESAGDGAEQRVVFTIALAQDDRPSAIEIGGGEVEYRLSVRHRSGGGGTTTIQVDLRRVERRRRGDAHETQLSMTSRVALGRRVVLGRIERPGGATEVAVTLR